jgi:hypothetical protein
LDDFFNEKGIIVMRDGDDKTYTLVPVFSLAAQKNIGPFLLRDNSDRFFG